MKKISHSLYLLLLLVLFISLNAGFFSILPISGIGFASYMLFFFILLCLEFENNFVLKKFNIPYFIIFLWLIFLLIIKPTGTINALYSWFLGGLVMCSFNYIKTDQKYFYYFALFSFIFALLFSLFEIISGFHLPLSRYVKLNLSSITTLDLHIPTYYFTNENDFCAFFTLLFCLIRTIKSDKRVVFDIIFLPYLVFCLFISDAKICLGAILFYFMYINFMKLNKLLRFFVFVFVCSFIFFVFIYFIIPSIINLNNLGSKNSIIVRINLMLIALDNIFVKKNFFGLGPGSFPSIIEFNSGTGSIVDPHNFFIEIGVEVGLLFLIIYIIFIIIYILCEQNVLYKALFFVFLFCNFCSSRFTGILWNWFFLAFFLKRLFYIKELKHEYNFSHTNTP